MTNNLPPQMASTTELCLHFADSIHANSNWTSLNYLLPIMYTFLFPFKTQFVQIVRTHKSCLCLLQVSPRLGHATKLQRSHATLTGVLCLYLCFCLFLSFCLYHCFWLFPCLGFVCIQICVCGRFSPGQVMQQSCKGWLAALCVAGISFSPFFNIFK